MTDERTQDPEGRELVQPSSTSDTPEHCPHCGVPVQSKHQLALHTDMRHRPEQVETEVERLKKTAFSWRANTTAPSELASSEQELEDAADIVYAEMIWIMEAYFNAMGQHGLPIVDATTLIERLNAWRSKSVLEALEEAITAIEAAFFELYDDVSEGFDHIVVENLRAQLREGPTGTSGGEDE